MKLSKYIQQLLLDNEMVIIPGFGAFISEYQAAEIDNASDEIKPPSTRLIFNPQIRNNDGLLVGHVAEQTRNSHFEALQKIEKERDNIIYQLDKGEKIELEELGTLYYNSDNQIEFISESDKNLSHESFGLESISLTEPEQTEEIIEEKVSEEKETPEDTVENIEEHEEQSNEQEQETEIDEPVDDDISEEDSIEVEETLEEPESEETEKAVILPPVTTQQEEKETQEDEPVPVENTDEPEKEKKRKGGWIWILAVLIPLIAVSVFLLMNDKQNSTPVVTQEQPSQPEIKEEPVAIIDSSVTDSTAILSPQDSVLSGKVEAEKENIAETSGTKFYLIGGSFKEEENAETYMDVLKEKGFEPFKMGKYGNFYILGIGTYDTEEEAVAAKQEFLDKNPDSGIWVLEK